MAKQFGESLLADLVHTVFIYAFLKFDASAKKLFITMFCFVFCLAAVVVQVNTANNIQYL